MFFRILKGIRVSEKFPHFSRNRDFWLIISLFVPLNFLNIPSFFRRLPLWTQEYFCDLFFCPISCPQNFTISYSSVRLLSRKPHLRGMAPAEMLNSGYLCLFFLTAPHTKISRRNNPRIPGQINRKYGDPFLLPDCILFQTYSEAAPLTGIPGFPGYPSPPRRLPPGGIFSPRLSGAPLFCLLPEPGTLPRKVPAWSFPPERPR